MQTILEQYKKISLLEKTKALLEWDLNVYMPAKGAEGRGKQMTQLADLVADLWLNPEFKDKVLHTEEDTLNEEEKASLRNVKRLGHYYFSVPKDLILKKVELTTIAFTVWQEAKKNNDFKSFQLYLEKIVALDQEIAEHLGYKENPYDALLNLYEPGLSTAQLNTIFDPLQSFLSSFIVKLKKASLYEEQNSLFTSQKYDIKAQQELCDTIMKTLHYKNDEGRLDVSSHPFTTTIDRYDVRITTRFAENDFRDSLMSTIHEVGHALYELGVNSAYSYTPLEGGVSMAIHESQSRFWENQIGRNASFIKYLLPLLLKHFSKIKFTEENVMFALNDVRPDFIRTEADEVTYNLHIILRFQLEEQLIYKKIKVKDLPEIWRETMKALLGIEPPTDREGVLQDIHWSMGAFGYFPTYALGNLYAAQFTETMRKEISLESQIEKGEIRPVLKWLRENIHVHGSQYYPNELVKKVTGKALSSQYFMDYIERKYSALYQI